MNYRFGDCELDTGLYMLQRAGKTIRLRPKVFRVCLYLLEQRDRVVSREELCAQVWSGQFISQTTLEGVIRAVRQAVGDSGHRQSIIQTLHGYGYRFVAQIEEQAASAVGSARAPAAVEFVAEGSSPYNQAGHVIEPIASRLVPEDKPDEKWPVDPSDGTTVGDTYATSRQAENTAAAQGGTSPSTPRRRMRSRVMMILSVLIVSLLGGRELWLAIRTAEVVPLDRSRIAVLPFLNLSAEPDRAHFADGMTEVMIGQLSQVPGVTVIARTSVMKYKDTRKDVSTIGRELRVGTLLEGSVRTIDNQIRVNAQLIDVASQGHLWSQEFEGELRGVFGIQKDIATRIVQQLTKQLMAGENKPVEADKNRQLDTLSLSLPSE